jgi:Flp pilus assembly protein TadB
MPNLIVIGTNTGWVVGYSIGVAVVLVVVALVVPILLLAKTIGGQAKRIDDGLAGAVDNTAALSGLETTIASANTITDGLRSGRHRLGG